VPHAVLSARVDVYEARVDIASELRQQSVDRILDFTEDHKDFLGSFQDLQGRFNDMVCWPTCKLTSVTHFLK